MTNTKPFYELTSPVDIINLGEMLEYQLQEGMPPRLVANKIMELAAGLFSVQADLRQALQVREHRIEWWATYRSAVSGLSVDLAGRISRAADAEAEVVSQIHAAASWVADKAHGPIEKPTPE